MSNLKPHPLLDAVKSQFGLVSDAELCRLLDVFPYPVSRVRNGKLPVGRALMMRIHEKAGLPMARIKELAAA